MRFASDQFALDILRIKCLIWCVGRRKTLSFSALSLSLSPTFRSAAINITLHRNKSLMPHTHTPIHVHAMYVLASCRVCERLLLFFFLTFFTTFATATALQKSCLLVVTTSCQHRRCLNRLFNPNENGVIGCRRSSCHRARKRTTET